MAQEETQVTEEQKAAALEAAQHGRVADLDKKAEGDDEEHGTPLSEEDKTKSEEKTDEDKTEEEDTPDDDKSWQEDWISTGNDDADAAIELMKEAGMKPVEGNEVFKDAIETGDLSKVRWDLLEARLGPAKARLVRNGVESYYNNQYKEQVAVRDEAYEKVGGEENWNKIKAWAGKKEKADGKFKAELAEWRKALELGGFAARAAVDAIHQAYEADPKNGSLGGKKQERGTAKPAAPAVEGAPLTRAGYFEAMERAGGDRAPESVKAALRARRAAGQAQGI